MLLKLCIFKYERRSSLCIISVAELFEMMRTFPWNLGNLRVRCDTESDQLNVRQRESWSTKSSYLDAETRKSSLASPRTIAIQQSDNWIWVCSVSRVSRQRIRIVWCGDKTIVTGPCKYFKKQIHSLLMYPTTNVGLTAKHDGRWEAITYVNSIQTKITDVTFVAR